ncbi:recombinase family protein [Marinospirillum sp. MEB164]|uniref:Recombinase family protein n=1 Tax=Marinospirillum alkalitolerans TaxID=3123374 RepID=A0ABW8Q146_9GAMM
MGDLVGWARVSSVGQDLAGQVQELEAAGCRKIFQGKHSGKAETNQAALDAMLVYLREGDTLVVTKLDRLGRSLRQVLAVVDQLKEKGVTLQALHQGLDTRRSDPMNTAMLQLLGMFAEMERNFIVERTWAGKEASGNFGGRKPKLTPTQKAEIQALHAQGASKAELARRFSVSRMTVMRVVG